VAKPVARVHGHGGLDRGEYRTPELLGFVREALGGEDPVLRSIREGAPELGLPPISIGPDEGRILEMLARSCAAKRAVEIGTLAGYSACWIARALPAYGTLDTVEYEPKHAAIARANLERAGLSEKVTVHKGAGLSVLPKLKGDYDFCFIDADKVSYPHYLKWAIKRVKPGGIVVGDNAYLFGKLHLEGEKAGPDAAGSAAMREFLALLADAKHFRSCAMIPTGEGMAVGVRA